MKKLTITATICLLIFGMFSCNNEDEINNTNNDNIEDFLTIFSPEKEFTKIYPNSTYTINWNTNISGNISIEIFDGNGNTYSIREEIFAEDKQFIWSVPSEIGYTPEAKFRVRSINKPDLFSESNYSFRLGLPNQNEWVKIIHPNGGESYPQNCLTRIKWSSNSTSQVLLKVFYENSEVGYFHSPQASDDTTVYIYWTDFPIGNKYRIKACLENKPSVFDFSDNYFTITEADVEDDDDDDE